MKQQMEVRKSWLERSRLKEGRPGEVRESRKLRERWSQLLDLRRLKPFSSLGVTSCLSRANRAGRGVVVGGREEPPLRTHLARCWAAACPTAPLRQAGMRAWPSGSPRRKLAKRSRGWSIARERSWTGGRAVRHLNQLQDRFKRFAQEGRRTKRGKNEAIRSVEGR